MIKKNDKKGSDKEKRENLYIYEHFFIFKILNYENIDIAPDSMRRLIINNNDFIKVWKFNENKEESEINNNNFNMKEKGVTIRTHRERIQFENSTGGERSVEENKRGESRSHSKRNTKRFTTRRTKTRRVKKEKKEEKKIVNDNYDYHDLYL